MHAAFTVAFTHEHQPLRGVDVRVNGFDGVAFRRVSGSDGTATFSKLPLGEYSMEAKLLGIGAGFKCFHISKQSGLRAKRSIHIKDWGTGAIRLRSAEGILRDRTPGEGPNALLRFVRSRSVPMASAKLELRNPITGLYLQTESNLTGSFAFGPVPDGTYVLHIEPGKSRAEFGPTDLLISIDAKASEQTLPLVKMQSGCGGVYMEPDNSAT